MPNLGAGVDQHVNTAAVPTWVYQPPAYTAGSNYTPTLRIYNEGTQLIYVGGANVSPFNGLPLAPGSEPLKLQNAQFGTIYTCSNVTTGASATTMSAAYNAGTSSFVTAASVPTANFVVGGPFVVGVTGSQEVLVISTISTSYTTIGTTTVSLYDHKTGAPVYAATSVPGQVRVTAGT